METATELLEHIDAADEHRVDDDALLRALLELAESAERNHQRTQTEAADSPMSEAA